MTGTASFLTLQFFFRLLSVERFCNTLKTSRTLVLNKTISPPFFSPEPGDLTGFLCVLLIPFSRQTTDCTMDPKTYTLWLILNIPTPRTPFANRTWATTDGFFPAVHSAASPFPFKLPWQFFVKTPTLSFFQRITVRRPGEKIDWDCLHQIDGLPFLHPGFLPPPPNHMLWNNTSLPLSPPLAGFNLVFSPTFFSGVSVISWMNNWERRCHPPTVDF